MGHMWERLHHEYRLRRAERERADALRNAMTPSQRHELEVIFQRAAG